MLARPQLRHVSWPPTTLPRMLGTNRASKLAQLPQPGRIVYVINSLPAHRAFSAHHGVFEASLHGASSSQHIDAERALLLDARS